MLNKNDINRSFLEVFHSMEENVEYELLPDSFNELNMVRKEYNYSVIKPFVFKRVKGDIIFDWKKNDWGKTKIEIKSSKSALAFALTGIAFSFSLALVFAENQIQKAKETCEGKIVEIDGKKYKLVSA